MSRYQYCFDKVLGHEGLYADHKNDRGGPTNYGVTQKTYDEFCDLTGRHRKPVRGITMEEVDLIYGGYWKNAHCARFAPPLDLMVFDAAIHHGPRKAIVLLQRALGMPESIIQATLVQSQRRS